MSSLPLDSKLCARFLRLLEIAGRKPSIEALTELVTAYMIRIPFENVSKLYYVRTCGSRALPGLDRYLDGIEHHNFGGTCYSNNYYLYLLLSQLGYDVMLCGAEMANPDVHLVNIVSLDGREYLVDAGYAAPFLHPLPRDWKRNHVISLGRDRYVLRPRDEQGCSRVDLYRDGQHKHGYLVKPVPRQIEHFSRIIEESFRDTATFMNALLLVRWFPNRSIAIHNLSVIESEGADYRIHRLADRDQLPMAVERYFAIAHEIVSEAIAGLGELGDAWN